MDTSQGGPTQQPRQPEAVAGFEKNFNRFRYGSESTAVRNVSSFHSRPSTGRSTAVSEASTRREGALSSARDVVRNRLDLTRRRGGGDAFTRGLTVERPSHMVPEPPRAQSSPGQSRKKQQMPASIARYSERPATSGGSSSLRDLDNGGKQFSCTIQEGEASQESLRFSRYHSTLSPSGWSPQHNGVPRGSFTRRERLHALRETAKQGAREAVSAEKKRYEHRKTVSHGDTAKALHDLHTLGRLSEILASDVEHETEELKQCIRGRYNKLFGALAVSSQDLKAELGIAAEELYGSHVGEIVRGEESVSSSALRSPERVSSASLEVSRSLRSNRWRLSARTRRVQTHGQLPYAGIGAYARNALADRMLPKPEQSFASWALNQASVESCGTGWASARSTLVARAADDPLRSLKELSSDAPAFKSLFADQSWADDELQASQLPSAADARVDSRLVRGGKDKRRREREEGKGKEVLGNISIGTSREAPPGATELNLLPTHLTRNLNP